MKTLLTPQQIESYRERGFLAIEEFLDAAELQTWRDVTDDAVAARLRDFSGLTNQQNADDYH